MIRKSVIVLVILITSFAIPAYCHSCYFTGTCDSMIISIDEDVIRKVPLCDSMSYDSSTSVMCLIVKNKYEGDIDVKIWYNSLYYELTLPPDLRIYGNIIRLKVYTPKVKKNKPSVFSFGASAGQLGVCGYGIVMKCEPVR